jgi:hypothetical protein
MPPVPPWRFAPFRARAAFDVNLCTDSVLPESIDPVRLRYAWVLWPLLSCIPWKACLLECRMGPFPALAPQRNSSIVTGLLPSGRLCPPIEGSISCKRRGIRPPKASAIPPKTHSLRLLPAAFLGFSQRDCIPRASLYEAIARVLRRTPWLRRLLHFTRHPNSQTGACGHSSQCPAPRR